MTESFVIEGELWLYAQEGGFAADGWELDGDELAEMIVEHFKAKRRKAPKDAYKLSREDMRRLRAGDVPLGRVRVTIEQLEEPEPWSRSQ